MPSESSRRACISRPPCSRRTKKNRPSDPAGPSVERQRREVKREEGGREFRGFGRSRPPRRKSALIQPTLVPETGAETVTRKEHATCKTWRSNGDALREDSRLPWRSRRSRIPGSRHSAHHAHRDPRRIPPSIPERRESGPTAQVARRRGDRGCSGWISPIDDTSKSPRLQLGLEQARFVRV